MYSSAVPSPAAMVNPEANGGRRNRRWNTVSPSCPPAFPAAAAMLSWYRSVSSVSGCPYSPPSIDQRLHAAAWAALGLTITSPESLSSATRSPCETDSKMSRTPQTTGIPSAVKSAPPVESSRGVAHTAPVAPEDQARRARGPGKCTETISSPLRTRWGSIPERRRAGSAARQRAREQRGDAERASAPVSLAAHDHVRAGRVLRIDQGSEGTGRPDGEEDVALGERPRLALQDEGAAGTAGGEQWNGEEGGVPLFGELRKVLELRGHARVVDGHRAHRLHAGAGDPLADLHSHFSNGFAGKPERAAEHQLFAALEDVDRGDGRRHHRGELLAEVAEAGGQRPGSGRAGSEPERSLNALGTVDDLHRNARRLHAAHSNGYASPCEAVAVDRDAEQLRRMGYAQQLLREMGGFANFALSFSIDR